MNSSNFRLLRKCNIVKSVEITIFLSFSLFLTSCMHLGMMRSSTGDRPPQESVLVKEITVGNVKSTAIFPQLRRDAETLFTLKLVDAGSGEPFSRATVLFHVEYHHDTHDTMANMHMMHADPDSAHAQQMGDESIDLTREIQETSEPGVYSAALTPTRDGIYKLAFRVTAIPDQKLGHDILVEAAVDVQSEGMMDHSGMMHGNGGGFGYMLIGAAIMGAMMLVVLVARGGMF